VNQIPDVLALGIIVAFIAGVSHAEESTPPQDSRLWVSYFFERVEEPTIWDSCDEDSTIYRATIITPDRRVETIRVTRMGEKIATRTATSSLDDGFSETNSSVSWEQWVELEGIVQTMGFWSMTSEWDVWQPDGTEVYIEGCKRGRYNAIKRRPNEFAIEDLMNQFAAISKAEAP